MSLKYRLLPGNSTRCQTKDSFDGGAFVSRLRLKDLVCLLLVKVAVYTNTTSSILKYVAVLDHLPCKIVGELSSASQAFGKFARLLYIPAATASVGNE